MSVTADIVNGSYVIVAFYPITFFVISTCILFAFLSYYF